MTFIKLTSVTSKRAGEIFSTITFLKSVDPLIKMDYCVPYLFDFHPKIASGHGCRLYLEMLQMNWFKMVSQTGVHKKMWVGGQKCPLFVKHYKVEHVNAGG